MDTWIRGYALHHIRCKITFRDIDDESLPASRSRTLCPLAVVFDNIMIALKRGVLCQGLRLDRWTDSRFAVAAGIKWSSQVVNIMLRRLSSDRQS